LVDKVSFDVKEGEIFGIAGVDGNGQTQLAEAIAGQLAATGTIALDGIDVAHASVADRSRMGIRYVTDDRNGEGTVSSLPVSINLLMKRIGKPPFWSKGMIQSGLVASHATEMVREYDIRTPSTETPIGRLSGGNIQKALIARELYGGAKLIIYNKPTHGLDFRNIEATHARIVEGAAAGLSTILISTDLDEVLELSDRVGVMVRGRLVGIVENGPDARRLVGAKMTGANAA
jgi:general nucleoside transport system ATP-binding protein